MKNVTFGRGASVNQTQRMTHLILSVLDGSKTMRYETLLRHATDMVHEPQHSDIKSPEAALSNALHTLHAANVIDVRTHGRVSCSEYSTIRRVNRVEAITDPELIATLRQRLAR